MERGTWWMCVPPGAHENQPAIRGLLIDMAERKKKNCSRTPSQKSDVHAAKRGQGKERGG